MTKGGMGAYVARQLREKRIVRQCSVELVHNDTVDVYIPFTDYYYSFNTYVARVRFQYEGREMIRDLPLGVFRNGSLMSKIIVDRGIRAWAKELADAAHEKKVYGAWDYQESR